MSHYGSKYEGYSPQNFGKNSRVICQQPSEISTFEGYLVTYLLPCKHGVKNEGYISVRVTHTTLFHAGVLGSCSVNLLPGVVEIVHKTLNLPEEQ